MKLQDVSNFAGLDGFCWFVGQVEARVITHDAGTRTVTQNTYDAEGNQIREGYEDEDVCKMNGILQEMLEHPGCIVMGWCDG